MTVVANPVSTDSQRYTRVLNERVKKKISVHELMYVCALFLFSYRLDDRIMYAIGLCDRFIGDHH